MRNAEDQSSGWSWTAMRVTLSARWPWVLLAGSLLVAALAGGGLGFFLRLDLPDVRALEDYTPPVMSRVLAADGSLVATFAEQRRLLVQYHDIPVHFREALVAVEDSKFYRHTGIDVKGIVRAAWRNLRSLRLAQGASTLTQQLARNLFLHRDKTLRRKLQEAVLALEIEREYTKEEILGFYCNQVYMGHGRYGLEAAARHYFGIPARELSLSQAAMIAGLIQRPEALSPLKNPQRALERRNHVLQRMVEEGMLSAEQAAEAIARPVELRESGAADNPAPYFVEEVRRWLQDTHGSTTLYQEGFEVQTTLDPRLQAVANRAMDVGLRELDKRQGWRGVQERVPEQEPIESWEPADWEHPIEAGAVRDGVVLLVEGGAAKIRVGPYVGRLGAPEVAWTQEKPSKLFEPGDLVRVRLLELDEQEAAATLTLEQEPIAEAALVAVEPSSGRIRALVGGFDFERSEFDRAIQARRQTGSAFKPLVFAAALAQGRSLADTIIDEPTVFIDRANPDPYQPENYTHKYYETITLRTALEKSANIATVKLLDEVGYRAVIDLARRLGITSDLQPYPSLALGSFEVSLLELTSAFGTFANQGVLVKPYFVEQVLSRDGALVERVEPEVRDAVSPQIAYLMNRVLGGVISDGTGRAASSLNMTVAGKTGTTDLNTDAWFIGYSPTLAVGVWVGFDEPRSLGSRETGAVAALPIWRTFMDGAFENGATGEFPVPPGLSIVSVDRRTGLKANLRADCSPVISEVFISGTEPTAYCSRHRHSQLGMPYPFQRFELNDQGELVIARTDLDRLLDTETDVFLIDGGRALEGHSENGSWQIPLRTTAGREQLALPPALVERFDPDQWVGVDGRRARVVWLR